MPKGTWKFMYHRTDYNFAILHDYLRLKDWVRLLRPDANTVE